MHRWASSHFFSGGAESPLGNQESCLPLSKDTVKRWPLGMLLCWRTLDQEQEEAGQQKNALFGSCPCKEQPLSRVFLFWHPASSLTEGLVRSLLAGPPDKEWPAEWAKSIRRWRHMWRQKQPSKQGGGRGVVVRT